MRQRPLDRAASESLGLDIGTADPSAAKQQRIPRRIIVEARDRRRDRCGEALIGVLPNGRGIDARINAVVFNEGKVLRRDEIDLTTPRMR